MATGGVGPLVQLRPMTQAEYDVWAAAFTSSSSSRPQLAALLPAGPATPDTWLRTVVIAGGVAVGTVWLGGHPERPSAGCLFDLAIEPARRGRGYGRAALVEVEAVARQSGFRSLVAEVAGPAGPAARRLFDSRGYDVVSVQLAKRLAAAT